MEVQFPSMAEKEDGELSDDFVSVCKGLLCKNPAERLGARSSEEIANHAWCARDPFNTRAQHLLTKHKREGSGGGRKKSAQVARHKRIGCHFQVEPLRFVSSLTPVCLQFVSGLSPVCALGSRIWFVTLQLFGPLSAPRTLFPF